jgi:hypothetical protein
MDLTVLPLPSLDELRRFVRETLCTRDRLDPAQSRLRQGVIRRSGRPCGLFFRIEGPRLLRAYAVWAGDDHRILFYDSTGARFADVRLSDEPDPRTLEASAA